MAESISLWQQMNNKKVLVDQSTEGTTYVWIAHYPRPWFGADTGYRQELQTCDPIWTIKKIVEDDSWVTEMFYPEGNYSSSYVWDCRTSYNYV
jgi:hypothetical protein